MDEFLMQHGKHMRPEEIIGYAEMSEHPLVVAMIIALNRKWEHEFAGEAYKEGTRQMIEELKEEVGVRVEEMMMAIDTIEEVLLEMARHVPYAELPDRISSFLAEVRKKDFLDLPTL
jgi:hypothetical protein